MRCHYRRDDKRWGYHPQGGETAPLIVGDLETAEWVLLVESQWDAFAIYFALGCHRGLLSVAIVVTRGATSNTDFSKLEISTLIAIPQNDPEEKRNSKTGRTPAEEWLHRIQASRHADTRLLVARVPAPFKDANDWIRDLLPSSETVHRLITSASTPEEEKLNGFLVDHDSTVDLTDEQIEALRPPFIIADFIRRGGVLLLGAESKSRKSWLAQDAGMAVAAGMPWLPDGDGAGFAVNQANVHVFDLELDHSEIKFRFAKVRSRKFTDRASRSRITERIKSYCLDGENVAQILPLLESARATIKPGDLVVIDCLYRLVPDGNETVDVATILETVKRLARDTGCGIIVVDHFRKASAEKARDRFAGTFVKQASASTLVAVEVKADDLLEMSVDARSFHGAPKVWCRWNPLTYSFDQVRESEILAAAKGKGLADAHEWLAKVWKNRDLAQGATALDASGPWGISKEAARGRLTKLFNLGFVSCAPDGKSHIYSLTPSGRESLNNFIRLSR